MKCSRSLFADIYQPVYTVDSIMIEFAQECDMKTVPWPPFCYQNTINHFLVQEVEFDLTNQITKRRANQ